MSKLHIVMQEEISDCGLACLVMIANYFGHNIDLRYLRNTFPIDTKGVSVEEILKLSNRIGMKGKAVRIDINNLQKLTSPVILHWKFDHFVVLERLTPENRAIIYDPSRGRRVIDFVELSDSFTGIAMHFADIQVERIESDKTPLLSMLRSITGGNIPWPQMLAATILVNILVLTIPLYIKILIDEAVISGGNNSPLEISLIFILFSAGWVISEYHRSLYFSKISARAEEHITSSIVEHILALKLEFFEVRYKLDVYNRMDSLDQLREALLEVIPRMIVSVVTMLISILFIFILNAELGILSLLLLALIFFIVFKMTASVIVSEREKTSTKVIESSVLYDAIYNITALKLFSAENNILQAWYAKYSEYVFANNNYRRSIAGIEGIVNFGMILMYLLAGYMGVQYLTDGTITLGGLGSIVILIGFLRASTSNFILDFVSLARNRVNAERVFELISSEKEMYHSQPLGAVFIGSIDFLHVSFGYPNSSQLFNNLSFSIKENEFVGIFGDSGVGKTTIIKLMSKIYNPQSGSIVVSGRNINAINLKDLRHNISVILQDDDLFESSIIDNITCFAVRPDINLVNEVIEATGLKGIVAQLPMGVDSLCRSVFSGGEKQKLLIARALYKKPKILIMDEASSQIDIDAERNILALVKELNITRIIISHRTETLDVVDRVIRIDNSN